MKNYSVLHIWELCQIYGSLSKQEKRDFYQHKCYYYQFFVKMIIVLSCIVSTTYLIADYKLNGNTIMPTLFPRLFVLVPLFFYIILEAKARSYQIKVFLNYLMLNLIVFTMVWAVYHLEVKTHFSEAAAIMNFIFLICCLSSSPLSGILGYSIFFLEVFCSHQVNHYENMDVILALNIPCFVTIMLAHCLLDLGELDHYLTSKKLEQALITDPLTTTYNRHKLSRMIQDNKIINEQMPISLIMLDIDYFKKINDTLGHYVGDQALRYLGEFLMRELSEIGIVIRFGGEEFMIILFGYSSKKALEKAEYLRKRIQSADDSPVSFTISVGVAAYNGNFKESMNAADAALYHAKESGRNQVYLDCEFTY